MSDFREKAEAAFSAQGVKIDAKDWGAVEDWEDDDSRDDEEEETPYQLGFPEEGSNCLHSDRNWREWDGGRIGGKPSWLDPHRLPKPCELECKICNTPQRFIMQLYCPLDEVECAFHRSLYVFACGKASCVAEGSVCCMRSQMPRENSHYPYDPKVDAIAQPSAASPPHLCALCGCLGIFTCTACHKEHYCSKKHQKQHWKLHKKACASPGEGSGDDEPGNFGTTSAASRLLYPEYDLLVSSEVLVKDSAAALESSTTVWEDAHTAGGDDEKDDLKLQQKDYDNALGNKSRDPVYLAFLARVRRGGSDQVLRYCRWEEKHGALSISSAAQGDYEAPVCEHCGAPRKFEFQIMPQLLYYLKVDSATNIVAPSNVETRAKVAQNLSVPLEKAMSNATDEDIEWGTLDVYTCSKSCEAAAYTAEHVRVVAGGGLD